MGTTARTDVRAGREPLTPLADQAGSDIQETAFASSSSADLTLLEPDAIPHGASRNSSETPGRAGYGSTLPSATPTTPKKPTAPSRAIAPDILRGLLMAIMALDHNAMTLHSWPHGTAVDGERDSAPVGEWNRPFAMVVRTLTHLCAPGFTFLLGMGVAYFSRSRTNMGWPASKMVRHFVVRAVVLTAVMEVMGFALMLGEIWFFNIVLFALAIDYLLVGLLWVALTSTEKRLATLLLHVLPERKTDDSTEPLLADREGQEDIAPDRAIMRAADISWHLHNLVLASLAIVAIWWNIWLSPTHGYCGVPPSFEPPSSLLVRIWFYSLSSRRLISGFPPLAWLSFAIVGLLYGRIVLSRPWATSTVNRANALTGLGFAVIFVATRLLRVGNLSEDCLHMPEHVAQPAGANPYLASVASFFYLVKYPPDVAFWSFTLSVNFVLLAFFGALPPRFAKRTFHVLLVFGTSALFFYVVHMFLLFGLGALWIKAVGHRLETKDPFTNQPGGIGVDQIWAFLANWAMVLAILYPLCRWYGRFKKTKGVDSLWRFF